MAAAPSNRTSSTVTPAAGGPPSGAAARTTGRLALGAVLVSAGVSHLTVARDEFQAQVPRWVPLSPDHVVVASGVVETALGVALVVTPHRYRWVLGWVVATFFVAIFPGNIAQYVEGTDGFGLDTDRARAARLAFQPVLVLWALWSTGAWRDRRRRTTTPRS